MKPVYLDLHIHTSDDPNALNENYDIDTLISKVQEIAQGGDFLISLTDHNVINQKAYLKAVEKIGLNLLLGVELHIRTPDGAQAYHCHIYFNLDEISSDVLVDINKKLDLLYPNKQPELKDKKIPLIEHILETFDDYDFILLPHGGQTHATFDTATPEGKEFDNVMQRSIYYNFFDGFTSRSDQKTEKTKEYLKKLGVEEFVNLVTCTDNYKPTTYPSPKSEETYKFIPTWMFATPTFNGLRMSLSDSSRLVYSHEKPKAWRESIKAIKLSNSEIDIDVKLTPGLNVIIGDSSSGKSLLVDSIYRKIVGSSFEDSKYSKFRLDSMVVDFPESSKPYFIDQNFIMSVTSEEKKIYEIEIIEKIIPANIEARKVIDKGKEDLKAHLNSLFHSVEEIETVVSDIKRIPILSSLITSEQISENILKRFLSITSSERPEGYGNFEKERDEEFLNALETRLVNNPFIKHDTKLVPQLKKELKEIFTFSNLEREINRIIQESKEQIDTELQQKEGESRRKKQYFESLITQMGKYRSHLQDFEEALQKILDFSIEAKSNSVVIQGYTLSVENTFKLDKELLKNELNDLLLKENAILNIEGVSPEHFFKSNFRSNIKGVTGSTATYKAIMDNILHSFSEGDKVLYKIVTPEGRDFYDLSPGLKTSIILELVLNFEGDDAPLIIDQPEDNLATGYINDGLVKSIKKMKSSKQIIFVSHNATIPMAGDAQNIILCENKDGKITIRSNPLEGSINGIDVVDYIAKIADGGKSSIKKRFKKYNLKKFREENHESKV